MFNKFDLSNVREVPFNGYYLCSYDSQRPLIKDFQGFKEFVEEVEGLHPDLSHTMQVWFKSESGQIRIITDGQLV